ncbi:hypothetical protein KJR33_06205 [Pediococcus pentosaceus]|uniref:hypothetical protein n=1 Tax=Pediococcus pentosaceus TaxID=1255 RepID=UPI001F1B48F6|nr:hypothetical protein [Pediococcus pentosaceus]MCE5960708.1 hypothetical protein [Pediococcus pentosaceus]
MARTELEIIEDRHPELTFWGIEVDDPAYHGHIEGTDVYLNKMHDYIDWLKTALHETAHYENDCGNLSKLNRRNTLIAEGWATYEATKNLKELVK